MRRIGAAGLTVLMWLAWHAPADAGQAPTSPQTRPRPRAVAAPPAPIPPATMSRGADGGITVRAVRIPAPLILDGRLDEDVYTAVPSLTNFIQQDPREGEPATEQTEAWVFFDEKNLYVAARCWDSQPERGMANEMRRDASSITMNENVAFVLDAFYDRRNGLIFYANILGGLRDIAITDESNTNADWNAIWDARTARFAGGWTVEFVVPFKSLRYNAGPNQVWGFNFKREVIWKKESSFLAPVPSFVAPRGIQMTSLAATLVGLEVPASGKNLDIKPYAISALRSDRAALPAIANKGEGDVGVDVKYGVTKSLTLDGTFNTDFAQVEDDVQQVNLTRFNLFFPEKREFFLEGQGIFGFGGAAPVTSASSQNNTPLLFFSRRIGLTNGRPVPITGGGRLTGRTGAYSVGVLNIHSGEDADARAAPTGFTVMRLKRDLLRRSYVGALYTRRDDTDAGRGAGETFGVDALYSASPSLNINAYLARTRRPGVSGDDTSHLARVDYNADRYGLQVEHLAVGDRFNPEVGFLRRTDFRRSFVQARFSPRPARRHMTRVRKFDYQGSVDYFENGAGRVETREFKGSFAMDMLNGDSLSGSYLREYDFLPLPFDIAPGVTVPVGGYHQHSGVVTFRPGTPRRLSGGVSYEQGTLYDGTKRTIAFSGRLQLSAHVAIEPVMSANWVRLPWGDFTTNVISGRHIFTVTPRMFLSALFQYNSGARTLSTNARFRWEYRPGSELFVVYSDGRDTLPRGYPALVNRAFVVKVNRLIRF